MKNKRTLLFAGILAAFLMLAVPFAVVAFDAEDVEATDEFVSADIWQPFRDDGNATIDIEENTILSEEIDLGSGNKVLNIKEGVTLTADKKNTIADSMFTIIKSNTTLTINGPGTIVGWCNDTLTSDIVWVKDLLTDVEIEVNGGTYYDCRPFIIYSAMKATFEDIKIIGSDGAIWFGNSGADVATLTNVDVKSDTIGLYLGCVKNAILTDVTVDSTSTALEIKSGVVSVIGGSYTANTFADTPKAIGNSGSGGPESTVFINNQYLSAADMTEVSVSIDDNVRIVNKSSSTNMKPIVVASGNNSGPVSLKWDGKNTDILTYYIAPADSPITINDYLVVKNVDDLDAALLSGVSKIKLMSDFESPVSLKTFTISSPVEIDGSDVELTNVRFNVGDNKVDLGDDAKQFSGIVTLKNLYITNANDSANTHRAVSVMYSDDVYLNIIGCKFNTKTYAVNVTGQCGSIDVVIDDSEISGYCAFQTWATEATDLVVKNESVLTGKNVSSGDSNGFATIVINPNCHADITIEDSTINTTQVDDEKAGELSILYKGNTSGTLTLKGDVSFDSKDSYNHKIASSITIGPEGYYYNKDIVPEKFNASSAIIVIDGTLNGIESFNIPKGTSISIEPESIFTGTIDGPEGASIRFQNVMAGIDGLSITAGSLYINGTMASSTSGTINLSGPGVYLSGTVEDGVAIVVASGCEPVIDGSLRFENGSTLDFVDTNGKFAQGSGDIYYDAGSIVNGIDIKENQKIDASTGASYKKIIVSLTANVIVGFDPSEIEVFVGDYYMDELRNVDIICFEDEYELEGWYTEFGLKITDTTVVNDSITTLVANMIYNPSDDPMYSGGSGLVETPESTEFDIADHIVLIEAVIAILVLIGFVAYIRKN